MVYSHTCVRDGRRVQHTLSLSTGNADNVAEAGRLDSAGAEYTKFVKDRLQKGKKSGKDWDKQTVLLIYLFFFCRYTFIHMIELSY